MPIDPKFAALMLPRFRLEDLDRETASVFGLWPDARLAYTNSAWRAFAQSNGGQPAIAKHWDLGASYLDAIANPLRPFYEDLLTRAANVAGTSLYPIPHEYECSSADVFRKFAMHVYPLDGRSGFIVVNSLIVETPHDSITRPSHAPETSCYANEKGIILQCCHCRRVRRADDSTRWDWVPAWVEQSPAATSHGLCDVCFNYYYPEEAT